MAFPAALATDQDEVNVGAVDERTGWVRSIEPGHVGKTGGRIRTS